MYYIETIILGNPSYPSPKKANLDLAVTFKEDADLEDIFLEISNGNEVKTINPTWNDFIDQYEKVNPIRTKKHFHFHLADLMAGQIYSYQVKSKKNEPLLVMPTINQKEAHPHKPVVFRAPPSMGQIENYHLVLTGDQEAIDLVRNATLNKAIQQFFKIDANHIEITGKIYEKIKEINPNIFLHSGDLFHGEEILASGAHLIWDKLPSGEVAKLEDFRKNIQLDFHNVVRDSLQNTISFRLLDDHDLGKNGTDATAHKKDPIHFDNAIGAFNEFFPVPKIPEDNNRGLYYHFSYGDIGFWCLHNRLYHEKNVTLLGDTQKNWLKNSLLTSACKIKFIWSPLPFVMGKAPDEDYRSCPTEWHELLQLFAQAKVGAIFTADSHNYSRADISITYNNQQITIPHFIVGTLGGKPQEISAEERGSLPKPLIPKAFQDQYSESQTRSYYTAIPKPGGINLPGGIGNIGGLDKNLRSYQNGAWTGEAVSSRVYGFADITIHVEKNQLLTQFIGFRQKESKHKMFTDEAIYPLVPDSKQAKKKIF